MDKIKRYRVEAASRVSHILIGEADSGEFVALIMALNKNHKATAQTISGISENDVMSQCQQWIDKNVERNAKIVPEQ